MAASAEACAQSGFPLRSILAGLLAKLDMSALSPQFQLMIVCVEKDTNRG